MSDPFSANPFHTDTYDPDRAREGVRGTVAIIAIVMFLAVVIAYLSFAAESVDTTWVRVKDAMQAILPAVTSVLGTVLGFYYGSQKN